MDPDETEAFLLFVSTNSIHRINFDATGYQTIVTGLSNGVAIDFNYFNNRIYWSDVGHGHIRSAPLTTGSPIVTLVSGSYMMCDTHGNYVVEMETHQCNHQILYNCP